MEIELRMPDLATTGSEMKVIRWLKETGQPVRRGEPILEVETDKATMELEAIASGTLKAVHVQPEDPVDVGQLVATLDGEGGTATPPPAAASTPEAKPDPRGGMFAKNRAAAARAETAAPQSGMSLSPTQRSVARRMQESKQSIPHFYVQSSANAERIVARRNASDSPVVWDAFFVHAAARALAKFERIGFRFEGDGLSPGASDAIGVAVDNDGELFVIALQSPAGKTPEVLSREIRSAVEKLRAGDADARRLQPARFTVTNLGATGIESFTAIVNPPEAAILAIGRIGPVGVVVDGKVVPQDRVSLTLSADHRVVNGKYAAEFLQEIVRELEAL